MAKFTMRFYALVECCVEVENIEDVMNICDLNQFNINQLPHQIIEIDDVVEVEEV